MGMSPGRRSERTCGRGWFIATKIFPASYCELGIERFRDELERLPAKVSDAVCASLWARVEEHGLEYVLPTSRANLIE